MTTAEAKVFDIRNFRLRSGVVMPEVKIAYWTLGTLSPARDNVVLVTHGWHMPRALRVYKEVGYDGMIMPDHVPHVDGDAGGAQAFAFAFGYIQALIEAVQKQRRAAGIQPGTVRDWTPEQQPVGAGAR